MKSIRFKAVGALIAVSFATQIAGCSGLKKNASGQANPSPQYGTVGMMNVNQVFRSMTYVTSVNPAASVNGTSLATQYASIAPLMSANGSIATLPSSTLLSMTGMAGMVCSAFLTNEAAAETAKAGSSLADSGVSFSAGPSKITPAVATTIVNAYANRFWGRAPTADELSTLVTAITTAATQVTATGSTGVQQVLLVPCTAMLASPVFISA